MTKRTAMTSGSDSRQGNVSTNSNTHTNSLSKDDYRSLHKVYKYLVANFPECKIMPTREGGKIPARPHKNGQYMPRDFEKLNSNDFNHGAVIILCDHIIVVDIDEEPFVAQFEVMFPETQQTVTCQTAKGRHYYFQRTPACTEAGITDGARQLKNHDGTVLPIDFTAVNNSNGVEKLRTIKIWAVPSVY